MGLQGHARCSRDRDIGVSLAGGKITEISQESELDGLDGPEERWVGFCEESEYSAGRDVVLSAESLRELELA